MTVAVVIPALNEEGNIGRLVEETLRAIAPEVLGEVIVIDDGSTDGTGAEIKALAARDPRVRYIRHRARSGQSAAIRTGVLAAQCPLIATMDGDGQNDPADIPNLLKVLGSPAKGGPALVGGVRVRRKAVGSRRIASLLGNRARAAILKDQCPDSGCGIKVFWREAYLRLPFFTSMHRFMPALFQMYGHKVEYVPVNDRPRVAGQSKYTNFNRALLGIYDMIGIVWLRRRTRVPEIVEDTLGVARLREAAPIRRVGASVASRQTH
ncbi:glycosyltransferase family 2 protein [Rhodomicrobium lacus]|uniref:glycosyltransferase family 2 protein n=1 Tax=Rhodomicrobium lacus TaxID=2498452 RepID=UPI000F8F6E4D|nr:glycosyltransferase family 2 protein [Rhodomicrobium lacus]